MATINSVLGPLDTADLGFTLPHEHLIDSSAGIRNTYYELEFRDEALDMAVESFGEAKRGGVDTVVEVSPMDLGRDVLLMKEVSERTGVQFICCTGCWLDVPRSFWGRDKDFIADLWVREIEEGIERTGIRAGIIKVATGDPITEHEELMLRASARTHLRTGVPITTHTPAESRIGEEQVRILTEEGVEPHHIYVGHLNNTLDRDYHHELARLGVWLGWDINNPWRAAESAAVAGADRLPESAAGRRAGTQHDAVPRLERGAVPHQFAGISEPGRESGRLPVDQPGRSFRG